MEDETLIDTTWVRLVTTEDGENNAVTGTSPGEVGHQRALPSHIHLKRDVRGLAGEEDVRDGAGGTSFVPCCHSRTLRQTSFPLACTPPSPRHNQGLLLPGGDGAGIQPHQSRKPRGTMAGDAVEHRGWGLCQRGGARDGTVVLPLRGRHGGQRRGPRRGRHRGQWGGGGANRPVKMVDLFEYQQDYFLQRQQKQKSL